MVSYDRFQSGFCMASYYVHIIIILQCKLPSYNIIHYTVIYCYTTAQVAILYIYNKLIQLYSYIMYIIRFYRSKWRRQELLYIISLNIHFSLCVVYSPDD